MKLFIVNITILFGCLLGQNYDIVIKGGRVIDPETALDVVRNVGINGNRIMDISSKPLKGKRVIQAKGLVVSPGFIDLHAHGQTNEAHQYQARDGVTTALEMEGGVGFIKEWIEVKRGLNNRMRLQEQLDLITIRSFMLLPIILIVFTLWMLICKFLMMGEKPSIG